MLELGKVISGNLRRLRSDRGLSLDALAKESRVSKSRLGQIERGEANPSVTTLWQIANALRVEFSSLITAPRANSVVATRRGVEPITGDDGRYRTYALFPFDPALGFEMFQSELDPDGHLHADPHPDGTWETVIMTSGELLIEVSGEEHVLTPGDAIRFRADVEHEYKNRSGDLAVFDSTIAYPRPEASV